MPLFDHLPAALPVEAVILRRQTRGSSVVSSERQAPEPALVRSRLGRIALLVVGVLAAGTARVEAAATEPYGRAALVAFDRLPYLKNDTRAGQQSSFDRAGATPGFCAPPPGDCGNEDFDNFVYSLSLTEHVMLDLTGPGTVYRMLLAGFHLTDANIKIYVDGAQILDCPLNQLFVGNVDPFLAPLVGTDNASSGSFYSYVPIPFANSILITTNGAKDPAFNRFYYDISYHLYSPDTAVTSWTAGEDMAPAQNAWSRAFLGVEPKPTTGNTTVSGTVTLPGGNTSTTVLDIDGPRSVSSIRLRIPGVAVTPDEAEHTDNGRAHIGSSQFTVSINPANQGLLLKRRLDYGIANQAANVYVDAALVGEWRTTGSDPQNKWRDNTFYIPAAYTAGLPAVTVRLAFTSGVPDWNEFYYWIYSITGDGNVSITGDPSDELDVGLTSGGAKSEAAHAYSITQQTWQGTQSFAYPTPSAAATDILNNTRLKIFWDNESTPSVDAPLGLFFAMGQAGVYPTRALLMGIDENNTLYAYFPMPFAQHAKVVLENKRAAATANVFYEIRHRSFGSLSNVGYFKTQFRDTTSTPGMDLPLLDATGAGHLVGVTESRTGAGGAALEGEERIYVDWSRSPAFHGTGTEEFYNGGWYFNRGPFTRPISGNTAKVGTPDGEQVDVYRLMPHDAIPFLRHLKAGIEHGGNNNEIPVRDYALAFYYHRPGPRAVNCDTLKVGNAASEAAHDYRITGASWEGSRAFTFEGDEDTVTTPSISGRAHKGTAGSPGNYQFTVPLASSNSGAILRRLFDQGIESQRANVYVDEALVGAWYKAGGNDYSQWREEEFLIPAAFTRNKSQIRIKVEFVSSSNDWNQFEYQTCSLLTGGGCP